LGLRKETVKQNGALFVWHSDEGDLSALPPLRAARLLFDVFLIAEFEKSLLKLKKDDCVWGPVHSSLGQESVAAATIQALRKSDKITGTHRSHHQFLSKVMHHVLMESWSPLDEPLPQEGKEVVRRSLAEIMGLGAGYCGGRGGSMHLRCAEAGFLGSNAIVGGGIPLATGAAFAEKWGKTEGVVISFFSDGATNQGVFHEACNLAAIWKLPVVFFIENNHYAVGTAARDACSVQDLARRAGSYGMPGHIIEATDIVGLHRLVGIVANSVREGSGPCVIEAKCYRDMHHAGDTLGSSYKYRTREEEEEWLAKNVRIRFPEELIRAGILTKEQIERVLRLAVENVAEAVEFCTESGSPRRVRPELWPDPSTVCEGLRSKGLEWHATEFRERGDFSRFCEVKFSDAISTAIGHWLEIDSNAVVLGEEVANFGGGAFGATKGLPSRFPDRVLNTPISEAGFVGFALGAAISGLHPIVEIMYPDFSLAAADQLFNQVGKARHMYGDTLQLPIVVRTRVAVGSGYGAQHSMEPVGLYALFPGWRIVAPSDSFEYIGLFNSAMRSQDPVLVMEHYSLYAQKYPVPTDSLDYFIPLGSARVLCEGRDVTVITYGAMVQKCSKLIDRWADDGVSVEIIDLRSLDPLSIDYQTIGRSIRKTGAAVVAEEAPRSCAIGSRITADITERFFDFLDGPVARLTSLDIPNPVSRVLETAALLDDEAIFSGTKAVASRCWR